MIHTKPLSSSLLNRKLNIMAVLADWEEGGGAFPHDSKKYGDLPRIFLLSKESLRSAQL